MDLKECIAFANETHLSYFATYEGGQPRVRPLGLWFADENGFYFQSHAEKDLCKQMKEYNRVEACWYNPNIGSQMGTVLRVAGEIEFLSDLDLKKRVYEERSDIMKSYGLKTHDDPRLVIFRIYKGVAFFWTPEYNLRESDIEIVKF